MMLQKGLPMPQLAKGGKFVFGWSRLGADGSVTLPLEARREYRLRAGESLVLISGSRTSGGCGVSSRRLLRTSVLAGILKKIDTGDARGPVQISPQRLAVTARLDARGRFRLTAPARRTFGLRAGARLLVIRSSDIAIGLAACGPLVAFARQFPELPVFPAARGRRG